MSSRQPEPCASGRLARPWIPIAVFATVGLLIYPACGQEHENLIRATVELPSYPELESIQFSAPSEVGRVVSGGFWVVMSTEYSAGVGIDLFLWNSRAVAPYACLFGPPPDDFLDDCDAVVWMQGMTPDVWRARSGSLVFDKIGAHKGDEFRGTFDGVVLTPDLGVDDPYIVLRDGFFSATLEYNP